MAPTLVILKSESDKIFGGYTDIAWKSSGCKQIGQGNSFLYSVRSNDKIVKMKHI